jgi:RNA polymerase sigma factor (sigma-70 family)
MPKPLKRACTTTTQGGRTLDDLYRAHYRYAIGIAMTETRNDHEASQEIVQSAMLYTWAHLGEVWDSIGAEKAWLRKIVRWYASNWRWHRDYTAVEIPVEDWVLYDRPARDDIEQEAVVRVDLVAGMRQLTPYYQMLLALRYFLDMTTRELAEYFSLAPSTGWHHETAARRELRDALTAGAL